ncbi:MAG TPA: ATP citrate lyase citrate-binding domain-containing protein [Candidatus Paceibacterota bacterium]|jgi:succinyl-CoA synthetase beta subunit|nr:ATP citrate lyase citrate-binding domain-containing protein [Candidatus Paceibacterota bacterium]
MARVKISEYRAKKILLGDAYKGVSVRAGQPYSAKASKGTLVVKVDQGIKKRFKQGLVAVGVSPAQATRKFSEWKKKGFSQFLLEPLVLHRPEEEQYLSLERVREGIRILHAGEGGIDIEAHPEKVKTYIVGSDPDIVKVARATKIPQEFLRQLLEAFHKNFFAFLEINPFVIQKGQAHLLDAACLVDSAGEFFVDSWSERDIVKSKTKHPAETRVEDLQKTTPASLKLSVVNPNGSLFFLLSGGGGSIVIADEAELEGAGKLIGNYGEYSGGPSREETYLYAKEIIQLMLRARPKSARGGPASGRKALVIAGGVANFTDIQKTFAGIIDALSEFAPKIREQRIKVFVRRGGPNERAGLELMRDFLKREKMFGSISGSDSVITGAIADAIKAI